MVKQTSEKKFGFVLNKGKYVKKDITTIKNTIQSLQINHENDAMLKKQLEEAGVENVNESASEIVTKKLRFHFTDVELPPQFLFDIELKAGIYNIKLNKNHPAFLNFFKLLEDKDDKSNNDEPSAERGLKLLLESWARLEDEASENLKAELQDIRLEWGKLARLFFKN